MLQFKRLLLGTAVFILFLGLYISHAYAAENKTGTVTASSLNLRSGPGKSNKIIGSLEAGQKLTITGFSGGWYRVETKDGGIGWASSSYVSVQNSNVSRGDVDREKSTASPDLAQKIVDYAEKFLGVKYVWGGSTPDGFDCSGFVSYVYGHFGISLERVAANQAKGGAKVDRSGLKPGDLVFFDTDGGHNYINHVGMYIGNGNFIQASSAQSAHKVVISGLTEGFYANTFMTARRII